MIKTIWHGSERVIRKPEFGKGKRYNDYGLGFYCTEDSGMAKEWGSGAGRDGFANCYEIECDGLKLLDLNSPEFGILSWLAVLLENRDFDVSAPLALEAREYIFGNFSVDYKSADIIVGYRADDSYFSYAQDFISGTISLRQLSNAMRLGKLGDQFVLKSREAFERLKFIRYEVASPDEWYARKVARDRQARHDYFSLEKNRRQSGDLFITHIIDEEIKNGDPRLR